jgi:hypothetical protein
VGDGADAAGDAEALGEAAGDADAAGVGGHGGSTLGDATGVGLGTIVGAVVWWPKYSASGTITIPTKTVSTNVTAPHSRRTKSQLTRTTVAGA